jgi:hypothetical protein
MLGIKCSKHGLYNGAKQYSEECGACSVIHTTNMLTHHVPDLERIQPINLLDIRSATTDGLLNEIERRIGE